MKKTLSIILSIIMLMSIVSAVNFSSFASEETETLIKNADITMDYKSEDFNETVSINTYEFTPSESDFYLITVNNDSFDFKVFEKRTVTTTSYDNSGNVISSTTTEQENEITKGGKYFYLSADKKYIIKFSYEASDEYNEFKSSLSDDEDYLSNGNAEYSETAVLSIYKAVNSMVDTYNYTITDDGITINAYLNPNAETNNDLVIPDTILGYPVTTLGMDSFSAAFLAKTITVPESVTKIDFGAFYSCKDTTIVIENSNCEIVESYEIPSLGLSFNNGDVSSMTFDDVIATLESTLDITIDEETKEIYRSICDINEDGYIKLWTIRPTATIKAAHKSTAKAYSKEWGCHFIGTDEHNFELTKTENSTCTKEGYNEYKCTLCDETKKESIPMLAHTPTADAAVEPTFTIAGKTAGSHCSVCGKVIVAQKDVDKLGAAKLSKVTKDKKLFKATWKAVAGVDGYEIQCATNKRFTKNKKTVIVKGANVKSKKVKKLKANKKYYVRIRAYKIINGEKQYSSWSKAKTVKTKK